MTTRIPGKLTWRIVPVWQQTALVLTGPLFLINILLSLLFSRLVGGYAIYAYGGDWFNALITGVVDGCARLRDRRIGFNFLAGIFKGTANFSRAFAAVSLAVIPAWVAGAVAALIPYMGFLIALAGGILSLVFLYRIMPLALNVPDDKRMVHFVVSLVAVIVINMVIGLVFGLVTSTISTGAAGYSAAEYIRRKSASSGVIAEGMRQAELMDAASADQYDPAARWRTR